MATGAAVKRDGRWRLAGASLLLVIAILGWLGFRALGESARLNRSQTAQDQRIDENLRVLRRQAQADCGFLLQVIGLPGFSVTPGGPSPVVLNLANAARLSFLDKGCEDVVNIQTGKPYGPPPAVPVGPN